jgi:hypothetical protein
MRERVRSCPVWLFVSVLNASAIAFGLVLKREDGTAPAIPLIAFLVVFSVALAWRGREQFLQIYGLLMAAGLAMKLVDWPDEISFPVFFVATAVAAWALFDRNGSDNAARSASAEPEAS